MAVSADLRLIEVKWFWKWPEAYICKETDLLCSNFAQACFLSGERTVYTEMFYDNGFAHEEMAETYIINALTKAAHKVLDGLTR